MAEVRWKQWKPRRKAQPPPARIESESPVLFPPEEIRSGAIFTYDFTDDGTPVYKIEANTARGLRTFSNFRDLLGLPGSRNITIHLAGTGWFAGWSPTMTALAVTTGSGASAAPSDSGDEPEPSATEVLAALQIPEMPATKRRQMVLAAEVLRFGPDQVARLEPLLRQYVHHHLSSDLREEQVAVASAIRKLVAMLPVTALPRCEEWLKPERKTPPQLEMEVVKMVTRKLVATLPEDTGLLESLGDQLIDILRSYLNPRTLARRFFGATAMEASLSLALLRSPHLTPAQDLLRSLRVNWFRATIARQARVTLADLERRFPGDRSAVARRRLADLAAAAEAVQP